MNRNELIGRAIGTTVAIGVQAGALCIVSPKSMIALKIAFKGTKKIIDYACTNHLRTDFSSQAIFSDAIDAVYSAY
jgi:hypothetical protein